MKHNPSWIQPAAQTVAVLIAAILLAGLLYVPFSASRPPEGYDQQRLHWNTKNSTRFTGQSLGEIAARVSQAVYPAEGDSPAPAVVILYDPDDWQAGLAAAPLLRSLQGVLLPLTDDINEELERLSGAEVLLAGRAAELQGAPAGESLTTAGLIARRLETGPPPNHALLVDPDDPATALLAAPWAAYSGDLVVFDASQAPSGLPLYSLGAASAQNATSIGGTDPARAAVAFASYEDPDNPLFGWGMNAASLTGYRAYTLARSSQPGLALLSANLAVRGKIGPLLWADERSLPAAVDSYLFSQRAAFWVTPAEGPFHHFWVLGDTSAGGPASLSFPAQSQADYAVEIGPYLGKSVGMSGIDMLAAAWVALGLASAGWILFHQFKFLPDQMWIMRLAWPLLALMLGPFGILFYYLAYNRPVVRGKMLMWDRPLWLQGMVAAASAVGFGASIMIATGYVLTTLGLPVIPNRSPLFFLGTPMILLMIANYVVAVLISWPLFQAPMLAMFMGIPYRQALPKALPLVLASMTAAALAMNPGMWWLMMSKIPMMPTEESILWFGVMFFTGFLAFLMAWPLNYIFVRTQRKAGLM